jgi:tetratricopeptide (TPR) repeat protein
VATIAGLHGVISRARFAEVKEKPTDQLDAYECVLQVGAYYRDNMVPTSHAKVRESLERAVKFDPGYAQAWAWLCSIYLDEYRFDFNPRPDPLGRALDAARRAIASDPTSQRAHQALAAVYFYRHELDGFFAETEHAIALNPNNVRVLGALGEKLHQVGDERGIALVRRAMALDPFHPTVFYFTIAGDHFARGEYEEALAAARKLDIPGFYHTQIYLAAIYAELGRHSEARFAAEELLRIYPDFTTQKWTEEMRRTNYPDDSIRRWVAALRKAGLPEQAVECEEESSHVA